MCCVNQAFSWYEFCLNPLYRNCHFLQLYNDSSGILDGCEEKETQQYEKKPTTREVLWKKWNKELWYTGTIGIGIVCTW